MNTLARFPRSPVEHRLTNDRITVCGKDATLAHRYPVLTQTNSTDRRIYRKCEACR